MIFSYEWGRYFYWLCQGQNAAAVQAICAIAVVALTIGGLVVTIQYVRLTKSIADSTHRQLTASLQPLIQMKLDIEGSGESTRGDKIVFYRTATLTVTNSGTAALKLKGTSVTVERRKEGFIQSEYDVELDKYTDFVLVPGIMLKDPMVFINLQQKEDRDTTFKLRVDCSDLSELTLHTFTWDSSGAVQHRVKNTPTSNSRSRFRLWE